jgi:hypothetical protein
MRPYIFIHIVTQFLKRMCSPTSYFNWRAHICSMLHITYWFSWQSYGKVIVHSSTFWDNEHWNLSGAILRFWSFFFSWSCSLYLAWFSSWVQAWHPCNMTLMLCVNNHVFEVCILRLHVCVSSPCAIMGWTIWPKVWLNAPIINKSLTW